MGAKSDFGPAEPEGRSQTRPVELLAPPYTLLSKVVFSRQLTFFISSIIDWEYDLAASEFFWYTYYIYNRRCRYEDVFFSV